MRVFRIRSRSVDAVPFQKYDDGVPAHAQATPSQSIHWQAFQTAKCDGSTAER